VTPLFWRCKYAELVGGTTQVAGFRTNGEIVQNICEDSGPIAYKFVMLFARSDVGIVVPGKATFGGIWTWPVSNSHLVSMKNCFDGFLDTLQVKYSELRMPPEYFFPEVFQAQHEVLQEIGAKILYTDTSYHIDLESWDMSVMSKGNRKKLRQCQEVDLQTTRLHRSDIGAAYELIEANRLALGVTPSVSLGQMMKMFDDMPDIYESFGTYYGQDLVAAAITVMITDKIRYVYMWADDAEYRLLSPVVALCNGIVEYSIAKGNSVLDLGTASEFGNINEGLARFKTNLGAFATNKITYSISSS
jgi:hypothetical protein